MRSLIRCLPLVFAVAVYFNAIDGSFHFDDAHAVVENPAIRSAWHMDRFFVDPSAFSVLAQNQGYRPLLLVTYALTAAVTGVDARAFIAVNLLVHVLCVLLFQLLLTRVMRLLASRPDERLVLIAAAIFALHPIFSECINYVSARSESLCAAFSLGAILAYLQARQSGRARWLLVACAAMASAMLVKAVAVTVPVLVIVLEIAAAERHAWRRVLGRLTWLAVPAAAGIVLVGRMTPRFAVESASSYSRSQYFISEMPAILHYVALFLWPVGQSADPYYPLANSLSEPRVVLASLVLLGAIGFVVTAIYRRRRVEIAMAVAWFLICILPSSSVFPLAEIVNEHRPYLAAAALCPLLAALLISGAGRLFALEGAWQRRAGNVAAALVLCLLAMLTVVRNRVWQSDITLWRDVALGAPTSTRAQMNYGRALMAAGKLREAEPYLRDAVRLGPNYSYAYINLGVWLQGNGKLTEARGYLDRAIAINPKLIYAQYHRGILAERLNEPPSARAAYFQRAVDLSADHADAQYHLATALMAAGNARDAETAARRAVAARGDYASRFMLAYILLERGRAEEAEPMLRVLQQERSSDNRVAYNLNYARKLLGKDGNR